MTQSAPANPSSAHVPARASAPDSWYHADAVRPFAASQPWQGDGRADVVVIGAGFTGASAALELARAGRDVVLLEAGIVGAGASGRNGGLVCSGWRHDQAWLEARLGPEDARALWRFSEAAKQHLADVTARHGIEADLATGLVYAAHRPAMMAALDADAALLQARYDYHPLVRLDRDACAAALGTGVYRGGWRDDGAGRIQPLKLLHGLVAAAVQAGARLHEGSRAVAVGQDRTVTVAGGGTIRADQVLLCGDGYLEGVDAPVERRVMPIGSFVVATEPLDPALGILAGTAGAMDTRFVVNYFQRTADGRLVFGGGEKYTPSWPDDIGAFVRRNLARVFPQLADVRLTHAWGGALGITPMRLPLVRMIRPGVLVAAGWSGQGVLLAPYAGTMLARALLGEASGLDLLSRLPVPPFPGGRLLRWPLLTAAMSYYALRDKLP